MTPAVQVLSADKIYPNGVQALLPVDLAIDEGEFVTLLGPSGCGKSTLLKMIAGLIDPTSGRLEVAGKKLAFVFQSPTLMPWANVRHNVRLPLDLAGVSKDQANHRVTEALALVGMSKFDKAFPHTLSGGMQMRASIARSLITQPELLLMDEPFGALDEITRYKLDTQLLALWQAKKLTVIYVTHSIQEAIYLSTRVVMIAARPGRVVEQFQIDAPYPRGTEFLASEKFNQYSRLLQTSLLKASQDLEDGL